MPQTATAIQPRIVQHASSAKHTTQRVTGGYVLRSGPAAVLATRVPRARRAACARAPIAPTSFGAPAGARDREGAGKARPLLWGREMQGRRRAGRGRRRCPARDLMALAGLGSGQVHARNRKPAIRFVSFSDSDVREARRKPRVSKRQTPGGASTRRQHRVSANPPSAVAIPSAKHSLASRSRYPASGQLVPRSRSRYPPPRLVFWWMPNVTASLSPMDISTPLDAECDSV